jgi:selenocysteine lyase/cysteine desulfurase
MSKQNFLRDQIVGIDQKVPTLSGKKKTYIYLDNAASTPSFRQVANTVNQFLEFYSSVHRGMGFKSLIATEAYDEAHQMIGQFVGADPADQTVIFVRNTTEAINKLASRFPFGPEEIVLYSMMEHHSNDLPWRKKIKTVRIAIEPDGRLNMKDFYQKLETFKKKIKLVAISGASNVSGVINPIYEIAEAVHRIGAKIFVDAAQLAPHRAIQMNPVNKNQRIDFLALSAHKMYAPYGSGALIGPKEIFEKGDPDVVGGGSVNMVTVDKVYWAHLPDKEEAGSPNVVGAIAFAKAAKILQQVGMDRLAQHEAELTSYLLKELSKLEGISILGPSDPSDVKNRLGVVSFNLKGIHNALVSSILSYEGAIGVRSGCFCAQPYLKELLQISDEESDRIIERALAGNRSQLPGAVRVSFGCYNTQEEIDHLIQMLKTIQENRYQGKYQEDKGSGMYYPQNFSLPLKSYFSLSDTP